MMSKIFVFLGIIIFVSFDFAEATTSASSFFAKSDTVSAIISPDGKKVAVIRNQGEFQTLVYQSEGSNKESTLLHTKEYSDLESSIRNVQWLDNRYIAVQFSEIRTGIEGLLDTKLSRRLLIIDSLNPDPDAVYSVRTKGWLASPLHSVDGFFYYAKSGAYSKIYKINIEKLHPDQKRLGKLDKVDGGQFRKTNEVRKIEGRVIRWFFDSSDEVRAALYISKDPKLELAMLNDDEVNVIKSWSVDELDGLKIPYALADESGSFYSLEAGEDKDKKVYKVNYQKNTSEIAYQTSAYKIIGILQNSKNELSGVRVVKDGAVAYEYTDPQDNFTTASGKLYSIVSEAKQSDAFVSYRESHNQPGAFYYHSNGKNKKLGSVYPGITSKLASSQISGTLNHNEFEIPYYLTTPDLKKTHPLIVLPHGGPIGVFDDPYFDPVVQYLASNGYAVLRVNYRGSSGYSSEFEEAGKKEWGGKILDDINAVVTDVSQRNDIDENRICVVGFSYGGYAAAMMPIKYPGAYKCAVNVSGVSDVPLYVNAAQKSEDVREWLREYVGDPTSEYASLKEISPVYRADELNTPILIAHGEKDGTVDVEHAYRLSLMLKKHAKEHEFYIDSDSGHNFSTKESKVALFDKINSFLRKHL